MNRHSSIIVIDKKWKYPKCPPTEECINNVIYPHNGTLLDNIINEATWMNFENITVRKVKQKRP